MMQKAEVVICGAGIGGIATAFMLAVRHGVRDILLVDQRAPMSLTSDKSTECYRNWWPGPGNAMVSLMNRSIDILEDLAEECNNLFHLNRRGYLYVTAEKGGMAKLERFAEEASNLGAGEVRVHQSGDKSYTPLEAEGIDQEVSGADILLNNEMIYDHFPYLSENVTGALHVRRAGWLSAQQYGMYLLEQAKYHGVNFIQDRVTEVVVEAGRISGVRLENDVLVSSSIFVNAAGPMVNEVSEMLGIEIPVYNELHLKAAINDSLGVVSRDAPLVIYADEQVLEWTEEEQRMLAEDDENKWLTSTLPSGAHFRPEGGMQAESILLLWDTHNEVIEPNFPPELDPMYAEIALRGLIKMAPGLNQYLEKMPKPYIDGGYYTKTEENRPLACPLSVEGAYMVGAMAGYGIMASAGLGELTAAHIVGDDLPNYASAFDLSRYQDPEYQTLLENWGESWQL